MESCPNRMQPGPGPALSQHMHDCCTYSICMLDCHTIPTITVYDVPISVTQEIYNYHIHQYNTASLNRLIILCVNCQLHM